MAFQGSSMEVKSVLPPRDAMAILIEHENGKMQRFDLNYGSGFASQSSREVQLPKSVKSVVMINYKGEMIPMDIFTRN